MGDQISDMNAQFQALQQQYQNVAMQREQTALQILEIARAETEVEATTGEVFKAVGPLLVKAEKKAVQEFLKEERETAEVRMKRFDAQEKTLRAKLEEMQKKFMETYKVEK